MAHGRHRSMEPQGVQALARAPSRGGIVSRRRRVHAARSHELLVELEQSSHGSSGSSNGTASPPPRLARRRSGLSLRADAVRRLPNPRVAVREITLRRGSSQQGERGGVKPHGGGPPTRSASCERRRFLTFHETDLVQPFARASCARSMTKKFQRGELCASLLERATCPRFETRCR